MNEDCIYLNMVSYKLIFYIVVPLVGLELSQVTSFNKVFIVSLDF